MILLKMLRRWSKGGGRAANTEWKVVSTASGLVAALLVRRLLGLVWARVSPTGHEPPLNPADRRIGWGEALAWAVASGAGVGAARVVSDRVAAKGWELATGEPPPGMLTD